MRTYVPTGREAEELQAGKQWFVLDAAGAVLGRVATKAARLLIGKDKPQFTPFMDCGDHVIIINAEKIKITGNKEEQKNYWSHSGYPGGLKQTTPKRLKAQGRTDVIVREAVLGMLPKNKLHARRAKKLRVYLDAEGLKRHVAQKPQAIAL